jgi:nicotinamide-nucleotide amidase
MTAEVINVGTELLMGQVLNTDAKFICEQLASLGINLYHQITVGDNPKRLKEAITQALDRSDVVILSGGLGPTQDDLTKQTAAELFGFKLEIDQPSLAQLESFFAALGRKMTPNNISQAMFPKEGIILPNPNGTAPGCIMEKAGKALILLPGPPRELFPMFINSVVPYLKDRSNSFLYSKVLRIFGKGESAVEHELRDIIDRQSNPTIAPYAGLGEMSLRITARCGDDQEGEQLVRPVVDIIRQRLGDTVYSTDGKPLEEVCFELLKTHSKTLSVAESVTGGMLASSFVSIPGCSEVLLEGAVSYSNGSKINRLKVDPGTIEKFGAVSAETALEMAEGVRLTSGADIGISTTGIAGPGGGTPEKAVGLVYIGFSDKTQKDYIKLQLTGDRERIRHIAVLHALNILRKKLS